MKIRCTANTGENLSQKTLELGYMPSTRFQLRLNTIYPVYGILLWKCELHYLVFDPDHYILFPEWEPAELFEVVNDLLPPEWYFRSSREPDGTISALWGYKEMIVDDNHYYELIDHKDQAMRIFLKRKSEIDSTA